MYSVQNIVSGKVPTAHVARLRFHADADLNITAEIKDVFQHLYAQGECRKNVSMHVAEDDQGDLIVLVHRDGFDAEERTWESLRKIHSSAPDFVLKELRKLLLTRVLKGKLASEYGFFVIACDFVLVFIWLSSPFVLRLNKLWGCRSQTKSAKP